MSGIFDLLAQHIDPSAISQISSQLGANPNTTSSAISAALPMLLGGMAQHADTAAGAAQIHQAVQAAPAEGAAPTVEPGLLGNILGPQQAQVENRVASASGLDPQQAGKLLMYLAPIAVAILARGHAEQPEAAQQPGGLSNILRSAEQAVGGGAGGSGLGGLIGSVFG